MGAETHGFSFFRNPWQNTTQKAALTGRATVRTLRFIGLPDNGRLSAHLLFGYRALISRPLNAGGLTAG
jgi:hypothetical protein